MSAFYQALSKNVRSRCMNKGISEASKGDYFCLAKY